MYSSLLSSLPLYGRTLKLNVLDPNEERHNVKQEKYEKVQSVPLTHTREEGEVFDAMFEGLKDSLDAVSIQVESVSMDGTINVLRSETKLECMIRERKEKIDER